MLLYPYHSLQTPHIPAITQNWMHSEDNTAFITTWEITGAQEP